MRRAAIHSQAPSLSSRRRETGVRALTRMAGWPRPTASGSSSASLASTRATSTPASPSRQARAAPTMPAPTIATSACISPRLSPPALIASASSAALMPSPLAFQAHGATRQPTSQRAGQVEPDQPRRPGVGEQGAVDAEQPDQPVAEADHVVAVGPATRLEVGQQRRAARRLALLPAGLDRKSTRLNSSHVRISY